MLAVPAPGGNSPSVREEAENVKRCDPILPEGEVDHTAASATRYEPGELRVAPTPDDGTPEAGLSYTKLGRLITEGTKPPEELVPGLLYRAALHSIYGQPGHGKTVLAAWMGLEVVKMGLPVIYVDEENSPRRVSELLDEMGAEPAALDRLFHYAPAPALTLTPESLGAWQWDLKTKRPALVLLDPQADMLAHAGLNENDSVDVTSWVKNVCEPVKAVGGSVLILDHVDKAGTSKYARGSGAKAAKMEVSWKLIQNRHFDRKTVGKVTLYRDKDRGGSMPKSVVFSVGGDGSGRLIVSPGGEATERTEGSGGLTDVQRHALDVLCRELGGIAKASEWQKSTTGDGKMGRSTFYEAVKALVLLGHVDKDETNGVYRYESDGADPDTP